MEVWALQVILGLYWYRYGVGEGNEDMGIDLLVGYTGMLGPRDARFCTLNLIIAHNFNRECAIFASIISYLVYR